MPFLKTDIFSVARNATEEAGQVGFGVRRHGVGDGSAGRLVDDENGQKCRNGVCGRFRHKIRGWESGHWVLVNTNLLSD